MNILPQNIPNELKVKKQWVGFVFKEKSGSTKPAKIPMNPHTLRYGSSTDPANWGTFPATLQMARTHKWDGIGFVFANDYIGLDLDKCVSNKSINAFATDILHHCSSYAEYSPSGTGIHIIGKGNIPKALATPEIEIYTKGRFFTMTGNVVDGYRHVKPIDVTRFFDSQTDLKQQSITDRLQSMKPGNVDITLTSLAGSLFKRGLGFHEVFTILKPHANKAGHDDDALTRICKSVGRYHEGYISNQSISSEEEQKQIEIFTPSTHFTEYTKRLEPQSAKQADLPTGFSEVDRDTGGLKKGGIWVIGARTGVGKTSLSITLANNLLRLGKRVLFFSTEMDWVDTFSRFASIETGIGLHELTNARNRLTQDDKEKLEGFSRDFKSRALYVIEEPEPSLRTVGEEISRVRPDVFIFDHIQRVASERDQRYLELSKFIKGLNTLARQYDCAGIVNSQLNRLAEQEIPALHHLKECGALEEEAHAVILLSLLSRSPEGISIVNANLAKNRGPKNQFQLLFNSKTAEFFQEKTNEDINISSTEDDQ